MQIIYTYQVFLSNTNNFQVDQLELYIGLWQALPLVLEWPLV